jgi:hypothetical protein
MSDFKLVKLLDSPVKITVSVVPRGAYNNTTIYSVGDLVTYGGLSYIAYVATVGNLPTDTAYWQVVVDPLYSITAWERTGNTGTNPATDFLGTTDANALKIRTNNNPVAQFDVNGRLGLGADAPASPLHIKPYSGYAGSGTQLDSFAVTTNDTNLNNIYSLLLQDGSAVKVTFEVTGRQGDGAQRTSFTRSALFYKEGGNVLIEGATWQSDFTAKSTPAFDIKYTLGINTVTFKVRAANASATYWIGNIKIEALKTSA